MLSPTGFLPGYAAGEIYVSLRASARATRRRRASVTGLALSDRQPVSL